MVKIRTLNIATKLFIWACALIIIFFATTTYLLQQVREDAEVSNRIVSVNHDVDSAIQRMLERLYSVQDNIHRYKLIGTKDAVRFIVEDLTRFGEILNETLEKHPEYKNEWQDLTEDYEITLDPGQSPDHTLAPDTTVRDWTDILEQSLFDNQSDMETALSQLHDAGQHAASIGLYGLTLCLAMGIGGSLILAYLLNRSLTEVRRGIRDLGTGRAPRDVRVLSSDELGELALAFNAMAARLRREEKMRSDFIAMLSHEIRTPLTSVREAVDLIGSGTFGAVNEKQKRFLTIAEKETVRLSKLLTRLLTVSRMESGKLDLKYQDVNAKQLIESTLERLGPAAQAKGVSLDLKEPNETLIFRADAGHVQQVLMNLIGNGIKFSPDGGTVIVGVNKESDMIIFCIEDNGPGIPKNEQGHVFLKYYRGPDIRESVDGAGLGLAISKRIVDGHGGRMWLDSEPGHGSIFCFSLPVKGI
ncbi:MAG: HAMP domain-containing protein [Pseudodesulfovibrio sp.]|nr:HAMP domain-containing protein [Pseudodesulfovibrio sp.]